MTRASAYVTNEDELTRRGRRTMQVAHTSVDGMYDTEPITDPMQAPVAKPVEPRIAEDLMEKIRTDSVSSASAVGIESDLVRLAKAVTVMAEALQEKVARSDQALKKLVEQTVAANQVLHLATEEAESARAAEQMCDEQKIQAAEQAQGAQVASEQKG